MMMRLSGAVLQSKIIRNRKGEGTLMSLERGVHGVP